MTQPFAEYGIKFDRLAEACRSLKSRAKSQNVITEFWPVVGSKYSESRSFMVVGRAVNGWVKPGLDLRSTSFEHGHSQMREKAIRKSRMSLNWVRERGNTEYNPLRSQFWILVRKLHRSASIDWPDRIAWSNLYKIAPCSGGNPGEPLKRIQLDNARDLMNFEIDNLGPERLLFLTGTKWARPFLKGQFDERKNETVDSHTLVGGLFGESKVVVSPHPQGKNIDNLVAAIERLFASV